MVIDFHCHYHFAAAHPAPLASASRFDPIVAAAISIIRRLWLARTLIRDVLFAVVPYLLFMTVRPEAVRAP